MRRKIVPVIVIVFLVGLVAIVRHHGHKPVTKPLGMGLARPALPVVQVYSIRRGNLTDSLQLSGQVVANQVVNLQSEVADPVAMVAVTVGQKVAAGQIVARLDDSPLQSQIANAQAALQGAQAKLNEVLAGPSASQVAVDQANVDKAKVALAAAKQSLQDTQAEMSYTQTVQTFPKDLTTNQVTLDQAQEAFDNAQAAYQAALKVQAADNAPPQPQVVQENQAAVAQAQAQLSLLETQDAETVIRAPFAGTVTALPVTVGSLASPGTTLMTIQGSQVQVDATVSQADVNKVHPGAQAVITPASGTGATVSGTLSSLNPAGNAQTLSFTAIVTPANGSGLLPGEAVQVQLTDERDTGVVLIPTSAIVSVNGTNQAFVVRRGTAKLVNLRLGLQENSWAQVLSGVVPGDQVVISGQTYLADGDRVKVVGQTKP